MDGGKKDWSWMRQHMPTVVALLQEYRESGEGLHVDECWKRGVLNGQPNWFYAQEGGIAVGVPFEAQRAPADWVAQRRRSPRGVVLLLADLPIGGQPRRANAGERAARAIATGPTAQRQVDIREAYGTQR